MNNLERFNNLKELAKDLQSQKDKAVGGLEQIKARLLDEFDCKSIKGGKKLLATLLKNRENLESQFEEAVNNLERELNPWED